MLFPAWPQFGGHGAPCLLLPLPSWCMIEENMQPDAAVLGAHPYHFLGCSLWKGETPCVALLPHATRGEGEGMWGCRVLGAVSFILSGSSLRAYPSFTCTRRWSLPDMDRQFLHTRIQESTRENDWRQIQD